MMKIHVGDDSNLADSNDGTAILGEAPLGNWLGLLIPAEKSG